ncbi:MAG TPA: cytochrome c biogenesis protein CcsA [Sedimentisphaerales bacterium]|nr:cytochrome c biogenesis protein CcsA [Sedimentisphaerales bacterium]
MPIETTPHMILIYAAIFCYAFSFIALMSNTLSSGVARLMRCKQSVLALSINRRLAALLYLMGFLSVVAAFAVRWKNLGHIPLRGMFDTFLAMSAAIYPLTYLCRRLGARGEAFDRLLGVAMLVPAALVFPDTLPKLPPALDSFLFMPHAATYLLGYIVMAKAAVNAVCFLVSGKPRPRQVLACTPEGWVESPIEKVPQNPEAGTASKMPKLLSEAQWCELELPVYRLVCLGFPLLTAGLLLGSWWGQLAWGTYWGWDPKEVWSLATWLIFVLYFHLRYGWPGRVRLRAIVVVLGFVAILCTMLLVNLTRLFSSIHSYA